MKKDQVINVILLAIEDWVKENLQQENKTFSPAEKKLLHVFLKYKSVFEGEELNSDIPPPPQLPHNINSYQILLDDSDIESIDPSSTIPTVRYSQPKTVPLKEDEENTNDMIKNIESMNDIPQITKEEKKFENFNSLIDEFNKDESWTHGK